MLEQNKENKRTDENNKKIETKNNSVFDSIFSEVVQKKGDKAPKTREKAIVKKGKVRKKKTIKHIIVGNVYIQATYNNTIVTFTDQNGNVIGWSSAGKCGFKGPKKSTPYAAGVIVRDAVERIRESGLKDVRAFVKGVGLGREAAIRALNAQGMNIINIKDVTPIPHGGCRPKKPRRV